MYVVVSRLCGAGDGAQLKREANSVNNKLKIRVTIISKLVTYATGLVIDKSFLLSTFYVTTH